MGALAFHGTKYACASGDIVTPGMLILAEGGDGTVYVINYKGEKHPINYAGFMKHYAAPGDNPFAQVITIPFHIADTIPTASLISDKTGPAILTAPATPNQIEQSGLTAEEIAAPAGKKKFPVGIAVIALIILVLYWKLKK